MNDVIGESLKRYIHQNGLPHQPQPIRGWLMDMHPENSAEIFVLMNVWEAGIVQRIINEREGVVEIQIKNFALQIHNQYLTDQKAALWAVSCWFYALGKIPKLEKTENFPPKIVDAKSKVNTGLPVKREGNQISILLAKDIILPVIRIPAGKFMMGSGGQDGWASSDEKPQHEVWLDDYWIGKHPVTNSQWQIFMQEGGGKLPGHWGGKKIPNGMENHPVVCINWQDANAFCEWLSYRLGAPVRLPTEAEWEKAARGTDGRIWPWGNKKPGKWWWPLGGARVCNFNKIESLTTPVGQYSPQGDSPYGCTDMGGNVCEWTCSLIKPYPYQDDLESNQKQSALHVLRGGSFNDSESEVRCAYRGSRHFDEATGFRICVQRKRVSASKPVTVTENANPNEVMRALHEATEKARLSLEEEARKEAEEKARREAAEKARRELEERVKREAEEKARREEVEKARREAEEKARRAAAESARLQAEERAKREAAEKARLTVEAEARRRSAERILRDSIERARRDGNRITISIPEGISMDFVRIPNGSFIMGNPDQDAMSGKDEKPCHSVNVDEYWIGAYPVTNLQWAVYVREGNGPVPKHWLNRQIPAGRENHPVTNITWDEAESFCVWMSGRPGMNMRLRLPTEAEWEKAARGIDGRLFPWGNDLPDHQRCNFNGLVGLTTGIGEYSPQGDSPYGCADMAGNVMEWVMDWYSSSYYSVSPSRNPTGPATGTYRVLRGGSWNSHDDFIRASYRNFSYPTYRFNYVGFRCAATP